MIRKMNTICIQGPASLRLWGLLIILIIFVNIIIIFIAKTHK